MLFLACAALSILSVTLVIGITHETKNGVFVKLDLTGAYAERHAIVAASLICLYVFMMFIRCHLMSEMPTPKWMIEQTACYSAAWIASGTFAICFLDAVLFAQFYLCWALVFRRRKCETLTYGTLFVLFTSLVIASYVIRAIDARSTP